MYWLIIIGLLILIIGILTIILIANYKSLKYVVSKINKAEDRIYKASKQKYHHLTKYANFLKEKLNIIDDSLDCDEINFHSPINELNKQIFFFNSKINAHMDNNEKILKENEIKKIRKEIDEENHIINGSINYYNDNLVIYNKLIKKFPLNILAKILKYQEKDFIEKEEGETFKILEDI